MLPLVRTTTVAGFLALASVVHAATPITLPLGNNGGSLSDAVELPVPPPPRVARPDVSRFPLVLKPTTRGCGGEERRAPPSDAWGATPVPTRAPVRRPVSFRLG